MNLKKIIFSIALLTMAMVSQANESKTFKISTSPVLPLLNHYNVNTEFTFSALRGTTLGIVGMYGSNKVKVEYGVENDRSSQELDYTMYGAGPQMKYYFSGQALTSSFYAATSLMMIKVEAEWKDESVKTGLFKVKGKGMAPVWDATLGYQLIAGSFAGNLGLGVMGMPGYLGLGADFSIGVAF